MSDLRQPEQAYLKDEITEPSSTSDKAQALSRRRFVQGATLAAPAILTIRNGQAQAVASAVQCFENGIISGEPVTDDSDNPVLYDVDVNGNLVPSAGGMPISESCLASIIP